MSDSEEEVSAASVKGRHQKSIRANYFYQNDVKLRETLEYIFENPEANPDKVEDKKLQKQLQTRLFAEMTSHSKDTKNMSGACEELYKSLGKWQGILDRLIYLWNPRFCICVYIKE